MHNVMSTIAIHGMKPVIMWKVGVQRNYHLFIAAFFFKIIQILD